MIQRILKGDTSNTIALALADGFNYAGCEVVFRYQGAVRKFRNCEAGQTIQFNFTADETATMALGAFPIEVRLYTADGRLFTVNNADVKIEVTDCVANVREGGVIIVEAQSGLYGVDDLPDRYTTRDIRNKINEIIARLGGGVAALCLAACVACGSAFGAGVTVQKANLEDIHNDDKVVTSVTFDASGLAMDADVQQALDNAINHLVTTLRTKTDYNIYNSDGTIINGDRLARLSEVIRNTTSLVITGQVSIAANLQLPYSPVRLVVGEGSPNNATLNTATLAFAAADGSQTIYSADSITRIIRSGNNTDVYNYALPSSNGTIALVGDITSVVDAALANITPTIVSVNGQTGTVHLSALDVGAMPLNITNGTWTVSGFRFSTVERNGEWFWNPRVPGWQLRPDWQPLWIEMGTGTHANQCRFGGDFSSDWFPLSATNIVAYQYDTIATPLAIKYNPPNYATSSMVSNIVDNAGYITSEYLVPINTKVEQSLIYSSGVYQYMTGNTNAWFSGTNYITTADGTTRTQFAWEDGMDAGTVPCSMALWEIRNGQKVVWDQRDWTVWYWNFKSAQMSNNLVNVIGNLAEDVRTNNMTRGWSKYTAVRGLDNPDPSTLWVDTPKVQLMSGHQWEKLVEVGGAGYWTISGNGIELSQQDAESTFLTIKDFEGNACLTFRKASSYLVYCECGTDITSQYMDAQNRVVFHFTTDVQPTAEFSTTIELDSFVEQGTDGCPVNYEWTGSARNWDCHFILKPGITSTLCFARFKVMREGENVIEHTIPIKISGGIVFEQDGVTRKIRPTISGNTVNWVVEQ